MKQVTLPFLCLILSMGYVLAEDANLALNKSYTLMPRPGYALCTDADDIHQLTDGQTTSDYFWVQKGTVGWQSVPFGVITVDLGRVEAISGFEFTTAAGVAGVQFPVSVRVDVSEDGKTYYEATDLVPDTLSVRGPFPEKYEIVCLKSKPVETRGRFVRFMAMGSGTFLFCDEVRVFAGDSGLLTRELSRVVVPQTPDEMYKENRTKICVTQRFLKDYAAVQDLVQSPDTPLSDALRSELSSELNALSESHESAISGMSKDFRTILPLNDSHAGIYRVLARVWKSAGCGDITLSPANVWDYAKRFEIPEVGQKSEFHLTLLQKEPRAIALNVYNASQVPADVRFTLAWSTPDVRVRAYQAIWTDTSILEPVLDALIPITPEENGVYTMSCIPSGMMNQLWLVVESDSRSATTQTVEGELTCCNLGDKCPIRVTVYPREFPAQTQLLLGGWDYTNGRGAYNVNEKNMPAFFETVRTGHVNAPWGNAFLLENFKVDPEDLSVTLDTTDFDQWLERWPREQVREYFIFLAKGGWSSGTDSKFKGYEIGTPEFHTVVRNLYAAWRVHWIEKGLDPAKMNLLVHDEPNTSCKDFAPFVVWSDAIHAGCPEVKVWEDPCFTTFGDAPAEFFEACDVLCPNRPMWLQNSEEFASFYARQRDAGRTLNLYSCSGPMKTLDPYAYVLLQAWHAVKIDAKASFFWALGDGGGVTSWNEYYLGRNSYTPLYIDPHDPEITLGKHFEAMRESAQDYEYCRMFQDKLNELRKSNPALADEWEAQWKEKIDEILAQSEFRGALDWSKEKDSTGSKAVREWILEKIFK